MFALEELIMPEAAPLSISDQPRSMFSTWLGMVLLFLFFGLLVLVVMAAIPRNDNYEDKRAKARAEKLKAAQEETNKALTSYAWIDKTKGTVRLPIERAMELSVTELAAKKPMPAGPIAPTEPNVASTAPAAPPTASASPATKQSATPKPIAVQGPNSENRGQPTGAANPPSAPPGTQPGPSATPAASPGAPSAEPPITSSATPAKPAPGTPKPVAGATPP
ncbi:MAG: hypothetical protein QOI04_1427 [Verrucomicrobiota bacterium]|jgi:Na+-transporting methylmalonyl-CoA/oxaloacetate decarboxylase gamma subunit